MLSAQIHKRENVLVELAFLTSFYAEHSLLVPLQPYRWFDNKTEPTANVWTEVRTDGEYISIFVISSLLDLLLFNTNGILTPKHQRRHLRKN